MIYLTPAQLFLPFDGSFEFKVDDVGLGLPVGVKKMKAVKILILYYHIACVK